MTKHAPTPWIVRETKWSTTVDQSEGYYVAIVNGNSPKNKTANANHIVHCVNLHDELVEALENIMRFVQTKGEPYLPRVDAIEAAKSAIKKAKGTK